MLGDLMTTAEVASYLRLKERTVYELLRKRAIPATRATGKWLFPRALVDLWLAEQVRRDTTQPRPARPPVVAGSHDPLLEWALRESRCGLALLPGGSLDGLNRLAAGEAVVAATHLFDPARDEYNLAAIEPMARHLDLVLIEWAWREQGLVTAPGNPLAIKGLADLAATRCRVVQRQDAAGSQRLFRHLLAEAGIAAESLTLLAQPALSETDLAVAVLDNKADAGLAVRAVARQFRLGFLPLHRERFDLAVARREYFEPAIQRLFAFARTPGFGARARELEGYDVAGLGRVHFNP